MIVILMIVVISAPKKPKKIVYNKHGDLPVGQNLSQFDVGDLLWAIDELSLYASITFNEKRFNPKLKIEFVFAEDVKTEMVNKFTSGLFTQRSAFSKIL